MKKVVVFYCELVYNSCIVNERNIGMKEAIEFVMKFYGISWETAVDLYWDEVEAYMKLVGSGNDYER